MSLSGSSRNIYARDWYARNRDRILERERVQVRLRPSRQPEARAEWHKKKLAKLGKTPRVKLTAEERRRRKNEYRRKWKRLKRGTPVDAPLRDDQGRSPAYYRARYTATEMKRIAARKQRTPSWLTQAHHAEIEGFYHFAKVMETITGRKYHVDHIEPLQGRDVSGLHVPWNLQVLPAIENIRKGNRRDVHH